MPNDTTEFSIYKIRTDHEIFAEHGASIDTLTNAILQQDSNYKPQRLTRNTINNYQLKLLYKRTPQSMKWKGFLKTITRNDQDILTNNRSANESFILLLQNISTHTIHSVTGGFGYHAIQTYIEEDFGLDILSRLIQQEDKNLTIVREKSIMGGIQGSTKIFRNPFTVAENQHFGNIYQDITANIDPNKLTQHFQLNPQDLTRQPRCNGKASFSIKKQLTFPQLQTIINGCEQLLTQPPTISFNYAKRLTKKQNAALIKQLDEALLLQLWTRYDTNSDIDFDLCHKNDTEYLSAATYEISRANQTLTEDRIETTLTDIDEAYTIIRQSNHTPETQQEFNSLIPRLTIQSYNADDILLTKGTLRSHLFGHVQHNQQQYFLVNQQWWRIDDDFITYLQNHCNTITANNTFARLHHTWVTNEDDYNKSYVDKQDMIVLHKIHPRGIELCDILAWDNNTIYLCHIKKGFDNKMRDLCAQAHLAAEQLKQDINGQRQYIDEIYSTLVTAAGSNDEYRQLIGGQTQNYSKNEFNDIFDSSKAIVCVLGIHDHRDSTRLLTQMQDYKSNVAKFSLYELHLKLKGIDIGLSVQQIHQ